MAKTTRRSGEPLPDEPGMPGPIPTPDHHIDIPAAPSTHPPEPPIVPSEPAIAEFWSSYGPPLLLVAAGLVIVLLLLYGL